MRQYIKIKTMNDLLRTVNPAYLPELVWSYLWTVFSIELINLTALWAKPDELRTNSEVVSNCLFSCVPGLKQSTLLSQLFYTFHGWHRREEWRIPKVTTHLPVYLTGTLELTRLSFFGRQNRPRKTDSSGIHTFRYTYHVHRYVWPHEAWGLEILHEFSLWVPKT